MLLRRCLAPAFGLLLCTACHPDDATTPPVAVVPVAASVLVTHGNGQQADPTDALPEPVRFQVYDADNHPLSGITVRFSVSIGGGSVPDSQKVSNVDGAVETNWMMGSSSGAQLLEARVGGVLMATANATTCDPDECFPAERLSSSLTDATLLSLATYDSSGQTVHPDVVRAHGRATGFWMAITPYPGGNPGYENPSIFHSTDAVNWNQPGQLQNPVARPDAGGGYLSDPDLLADSTNRLWLYFRSVNANRNVIRLMRSVDGINWQTASTVVDVPSHSAVSPSVVHANSANPWQMWTVNAGVQGCSAPLTAVERRTSSDGVTWSAPTAVDLVQPGRAIWHIDVEWIPARQEYWAVYNTYAAGTSCTTDALYLARSSDGQHWTTYPSPIARAGSIAAFADIVYRSSFMTDPKATKVTLWISGATFTDAVGYNWQTAKVTVAVADLLAIASAPATNLLMPVRRHLPPPEPDQ